MDKPYTSTPRLPLIHQFSAATLNSSNESYQICCTCISEGGYIPSGKKNSVYGSLTSGSSLTNPIILLGLRIKSGIPTGLLKMLNVSITQSSNKFEHIQIQLHSTTNFTYGSASIVSSWTTINNSIAEYLVGNGSTDNITSDGFVINNFNIEKKASVVLSPSIYDTLLTRNQVTQYDTLYIIATSLTRNNDYQVALDFIESY